MGTSALTMSPQQQEIFETYQRVHQEDPNASEKEKFDKTAAILGVSTIAIIFAIIYFLKNFQFPTANIDVPIDIPEPLEDVITWLSEKFDFLPDLPITTTGAGGTEGEQGIINLNFQDADPELIESATGDIAGKASATAESNMGNTGGMGGNQNYEIDPGDPSEFTPEANVEEPTTETEVNTFDTTGDAANEGSSTTNENQTPLIDENYTGAEETITEFETPQDLPQNEGEVAIQPETNEGNIPEEAEDVVLEEPDAADNNIPEDADDVVLEDTASEGETTEEAAGEGENTEENQGGGEPVANEEGTEIGSTGGEPQMEIAGQFDYSMADQNVVLITDPGTIDLNNGFNMFTSGEDLTQMNGIYDRLNGPENNQIVYAVIENNGQQIRFFNAESLPTNIQGEVFTVQGWNTPYTYTFNGQQAVYESTNATYTLTPATNTAREIIGLPLLETNFVEPDRLSMTYSDIISVDTENNVVNIIVRDVADREYTLNLTGLVNSETPFTIQYNSAQFAQPEQLANLGELQPVIEPYAYIYQIPGTGNTTIYFASEIGELPPNVAEGGFWFQVNNLPPPSNLDMGYIEFIPLPADQQVYPVIQQTLTIDQGFSGIAPFDYTNQGGINVPDSSVGNFVEGTSFITDFSGYDSIHFESLGSMQIYNTGEVGSYLEFSNVNMANPADYTSLPDTFTLDFFHNYLNTSRESSNAALNLIRESITPMETVAGDVTVQNLTTSGYAYIVPEGNTMRVYFFEQVSTEVVPEGGTWYSITAPTEINSQTGVQFSRYQG